MDAWLRVKVRFIFRVVLHDNIDAEGVSFLKVCDMYKVFEVEKFACASRCLDRLRFFYVLGKVRCRTRS